MVEVLPNCPLPESVPGTTDFDLVLSLSVTEVVLRLVSGQAYPKGHSDRLFHLPEEH